MDANLNTNPLAVLEKLANMDKDSAILKQMQLTATYLNNMSDDVPRGQTVHNLNTDNLSETLNDPSRSHANRESPKHPSTAKEPSALASDDGADLDEPCGQPVDKIPSESTSSLSRETVKSEPTKPLPFCSKTCQHFDSSENQSLLDKGVNESSQGSSEKANDLSVNDDKQSDLPSDDDLKGKPQSSASNSPSRHKRRAKKKSSRKVKGSKKKRRVKNGNNSPSSSPSNSTKELRANNRKESSLNSCKVRDSTAKTCQQAAHPTETKAGPSSEHELQPSPVSSLYKRSQVKVGRGRQKKKTQTENKATEHQKAYPRQHAGNGGQGKKSQNQNTSQQSSQQSHTNVAQGCNGSQSQGSACSSSDGAGRGDRGDDDDNGDRDRRKENESADYTTLDQDQEEPEDENEKTTKEQQNEEIYCRSEPSGEATSPDASDENLPPSNLLVTPSQNQNCLPITNQIVGFPSRSIAILVQALCSLRQVVDRDSPRVLVSLDSPSAGLAISFRAGRGGFMYMTAYVHVPPPPSYNNLVPVQRSRYMVCAIQATDSTSAHHHLSVFAFFRVTSNIAMVAAACSVPRPLAANFMHERQCVPVSESQSTPECQLVPDAHNMVYLGPQASCLSSTFILCTSGGSSYMIAQSILPPPCCVVINPDNGLQEVQAACEAVQCQAAAVVANNGIHAPAPDPLVVYNDIEPIERYPLPRQEGNSVSSDSAIESGDSGQDSEDSNFSNYDPD